MSVDAYLRRLQLIDSVAQHVAQFAEHPEDAELSAMEAEAAQAEVE